MEAGLLRQPASGQGGGAWPSTAPPPARHLACGPELEALNGPVASRSVPPAAGPPSAAPAAPGSPPAAA